MPNDSVNHQDLEHAMRMASSGYATLEEASRISGVPLVTLKARSSASKALGDHACSSPTNTAVYTRSAKGVLTITRQSQKFTSVAKEIFFSIDGQATAADLAASSSANDPYVYANLKTWEKEGYIELVRPQPTAHESTIDNAAGETDLDFTRDQECAQATMLRSETRESAAAETVMRQDAALEPKSEWLEVRVEPTPTALKQAQESVSQMGSQVDSEHRSRQEILKALSKARTQADTARRIAAAQGRTLARMQDEIVAARRAYEAQLTEHSARNEQQARRLAEADAHRKALEADLMRLRDRERAIRLLVQTA
ncbi:MAG: hypothetical protein QOK44_1966 [Betaproteobacteria bacterium]|jgi:hypothetical protein|nr:hypothetical protein [Betaproteobacteria bacterium]